MPEKERPHTGAAGTALSQPAQGGEAGAEGGTAVLNYQGCVNLGGWPGVQL